MTKSYIYSDTGQILCQRDGGQSAPEYFYVTDRLGSVRQVVGIVDNEPAVVLSYTYSPFGQMVEQSKKTGFEYSFNSFLFTGQWFDDEFDQYYLRARQYDPQLMRFTARDPVKGEYNNPLTLHPYLYCLNDPVNRVDPSGQVVVNVSPILTGYALYFHSTELATYAASSGDWRFFDLAYVTRIFMPVGMAVAAITPVPALSWLYLRYFVSGNVATTGLEHIGGVTGMSYPETFIMDPAAFYLYSEVMLIAEINLGISMANMADFGRWHGSWW